MSLLDDDALAALASKGILRRARNDLDTTPPRLVEPVDDKVCLHVEDCTVLLAEVASQSRCTCPTTGACRHIVTAILFLRNTTAMAPDTSPSRRSTAADEMLAVTDDALEKWAGRGLVRKAGQILAGEARAEFEEAGTMIVRFPIWNVTCHWIPGYDLAGMICSCHASGPCEHRVAAVIALQAARGQRQIAVPKAALEASSGAPRTRLEVLDSVGSVLGEMVSLGLSRLSHSTEDRLRTLAVSAHGVDLPRLERMLNALADDVARAVRRDAHASSATLLSAAARLEALRAALVNPSSELVGVHRSRYEKVGDIDLVGLGARQWQTQSGYAGLTVYFWDRSLSDWATWSESRPVGQAGFDAVSRYHQDGPWAGCDSPRHASRHVLRLMGAWRSRAGRLSGRPGTRCVSVRESRADQTPSGITAWTELAEPAVRLFAGGLHSRAERDEIVLLRPARWGAARFDAVTQQFVQPVYDAAGGVLSLVMPHTAQTDSAIRTLEQHDPETTRAVLGLLRLEHEQLAVEPIAIHGETAINLTLDGAPDDRSASPAGSTADEPPEEVEPEPEELGSTSPLGMLLLRTAEHLEAIAEGGVRSARELDRLRNLSLQCGSLGLASVARPVARFADELDQLRRSSAGRLSQAAATLLKAYYVVKLAAAHEVVAQATASIGT